MTKTEVELVMWLSQFYTGPFHVYRKPPGVTLWGMRL